MVHVAPGTFLTCRGGCPGLSSPQTCHLCHLMDATPSWNSFPAPSCLFKPVKGATSFKRLFSPQDLFSSAGLPCYNKAHLHPPRCSGWKPRNHRDSHPIPQSSYFFLQNSPGLCLPLACFLPTANSLGLLYQLPDRFTCYLPSVYPPHSSQHNLSKS